LSFDQNSLPDDSKKITASANYVSIELPQTIWKPCMFWIEPQQFWNSTRTDSGYSVTVSAMEVCGYVNLRSKHVNTIKVCGGAKLHNLPIYMENEVTINIDLYYSDGSYLWDQSIHFELDTTLKCIVISGVKTINHLLLSLGSRNEPFHSWATFYDVTLYALPDTLGSDEVNNIEAYCSSENACALDTSSFPSKPSRHTIQPSFFKSSLTPVCS
jgi:hypothetical protein